LASFTPLIAAMGGNVGAQSATIVVRSLATGQIRKSEWSKVMIREFAVGLLLGLAYGILVGGFSFLLYGQRLGGYFALVVALGMVTSMTVAATIGAVEPFIFERLGIDPATATGPLITTTTDLIATTAYLALVQHVTAAYWAGRVEVVDFFLLSNGFYSFHFWGVQMGLGTFFPLMLTLVPRMRSHGTLAFASFLVVLGGLAQVFIIIVGGQAWPLTLFPGYEVESSFFDGVVHGYTPSIPEILLGLGGFALALLIVALGTAILRFLPATLADADIDPHAKKQAAETKDEEEAEPAPAA